MMLAGVPGLLLVPLVLLTVTEPPCMARTALRNHTTQLAAALRELWSRLSFRHLCMAGALHSLSMYGASSFNPAYLARSHGWDGGQIGQLVALAGVAGLAGTFIGGFVTDLLSGRHGEQRWQLWVPAIATLVVVPVQLVGYLGSGATMIAALLLSSLLSLVFFGPSYATAQALAAPGSRALAAALLLFAKAIVGMGLGPLLIGFTSDQLAPMAGVQSLQFGLLLVPLFNLWACLHFFIAARHLRKDLLREHARLD